MPRFERNGLYAIPGGTDTQYPYWDIRTVKGNKWVAVVERQIAWISRDFTSYQEGDTLNSEGKVLRYIYGVRKPEASKYYAESGFVRPTDKDMKLGFLDVFNKVRK